MKKKFFVIIFMVAMVAMSVGLSTARAQSVYSSYGQYYGQSSIYVGYAGSPSTSGISSYVSEQYAAINQYRANNGLSQLNYQDSVLNQVAQQKAQNMANGSYVYVDSVSTVTQYLANANPNTNTNYSCGYGYNSYGYNGYNYAYATYTNVAESVVNRNVSSGYAADPVSAQSGDPQPNLATILNTGATEMGVGAVVGTYDGYQTIFVAEVFATPPTCTQPYTYEYPVSLSQNSISMYVGQSGSVTVSGNGSYNVSDSNSSIAYGSMNGSTLNIYGSSAGTTVVTVCAENSSYSSCASLSVTVNSNVVYPSYSYPSYQYWWYGNGYGYGQSHSRNGGNRGNRR